MIEQISFTEAGVAIGALACLAWVIRMYSNSQKSSNAMVEKSMEFVSKQGDAIKDLTASIRDINTHIEAWRDDDNRLHEKLLSEIELNNSVTRSRLDTLQANILGEIRPLVAVLKKIDDATFAMHQLNQTQGQTFTAMAETLNGLRTEVSQAIQKTANTSVAVNLQAKPDADN